MKKSLGKRGQEDNYSHFKLENGSQLVSPSEGLQECKVLKAQVSLSKDNGIAEIAILELIIIIILAIYSSGSPIFEVFSSFIPYLVLLTLILYNRNIVLLTPEKIVIHRHLFKSLVLRKEDIVQISLSKNKNHSLRWPIRLLYFATVPIILLQKVEEIIGGLQLREAAPPFTKLNLFLMELFIVAFYLVIYYTFELVAPYQQTLKINTCSDLKLWLYTEKPEELIAFLKNGKE